ncbi:MAG TPA: sigma factor-like helix-turn-helix DNA-binding protein [Streptosporangiaceae bacterium]|nr:sigma factor-like helix-turn-helix DNA-binding protein [Streptosporangiaceae bacterium]
MGIRAARSADVVCTADRTLTRLYAEHFRSLVRLAALLVQDAGLAEEITEAAYAAAYREWQRCGDTGTGVAFLRRAIVNRARSAWRYRAGGEGSTAGRAHGQSPAGQDAAAGFGRAPVAAGLRSLPEHQREAVVLRYYADLSEAQAAAAMSLSRTAVKSHTARGMAALRSVLGQESYGA